MLEPALHFAGSSVSWLELWAFALALGGVVLTARVSPWGWPPTIVASALYGWLFFEHRLYGDAALQLFFIAVSAWGWRAWLRTTPADASRVGSGVRSLDGRVTRRLALALVACWAVLGALLARKKAQGVGVAVVPVGTLKVWKELNALPLVKVAVRTSVTDPVVDTVVAVLSYLNSRKMRPVRSSAASRMGRPGVND